MDNIQKLIGNRLRDLRKKKGLSQEELGWKSKLHYTYLGAIERGEKNCSVATLGKIAKGLGISVNEIFNVPMDIENPDKLKASIVKEIEKSDPKILKALLDLIKELNTLQAKRDSQKKSRRF